jgi:hypothetical protein
MIFREIKRTLLFFGLLLAAISAQAQRPALVDIGGVDRSICDIFRSGQCIGRQWDSGTVTITINGINVSTIYGRTSTGTSLASALAAKIPGTVPGMSASSSGGTVSVTPSDFSNFSITASATSSDPVTFGGSSFFTSVSDPGSLFPKYVVLSVIYSPPGAQSFVDYTNTIMLGTSSSWSKSFSNSTTITVGFSATNSIVGGLNGSVSTQWSQTAETDGSIAIEKTTSTSTLVRGPLDSNLGIDHDFDIVFVWLNPRADFYVTSPSAANWSYTFDQRDPANGMDVIQLFVSQLKNPSTITDPNIITRLAKTWDTSGLGGLTNADLLAIAQRDPFWNLGTTPASTVDPTRFDVEGGETFSYIPPPPGGQPTTTTFTETYQTTTTQGRSATDQYTVAYTRSGSVGAKNFFTANIVVTDQLQWQNKWTSTHSQSTTQSSSFSITGPPSGYTGLTNVQLYKDNVYGTFLPNFIQ